jgi:hypothetical protein
MPSVKRPPKPVDARFHWPRRKRDLAAAFTAQIGRELSPHEVVLVSNAAAMAVRLEQIQQDILNGKPVADNQIVRLNNSYRRILDALGLDKKPTTKPRRPASNVVDQPAANGAGRVSLAEKLAAVAAAEKAAAS